MTRKEAIGEFQIQISTLESMIAYNNDFEPKSDNSRLIERMEAAKVAMSALEELERWHTDRINEKIKNPFAWTSTSICYNCDHKDEYIEELEAEIQELKQKYEIATTP